MTQQSRGEDTGVVDGENVPWPQKPRQVADRTVAYGAGRPVEREQAGLTARRRGLGNQVVGERKVEI
jgi:hypothetical protein